MQTVKSLTPESLTAVEILDCTNILVHLVPSHCLNVNLLFNSDVMRRTLRRLAAFDGMVIGIRHRVFV